MFDEIPSSPGRDEEIETTLIRLRAWTPVFAIGVATLGALCLIVAGVCLWLLG